MKQKEIKTEIKIYGKAEEIWNVLTNGEAYPSWNPFIKALEGKLNVGQTIKAVLQAPGAKPMTFKPTVLVYKENQQFKWLGHLFIKGLFDGAHNFEIRDNGDGSCQFIQSETFGGILVPLFTKMLDNETLDGFKLMNQALKQHVEAMHK